MFKKYNHKYVLYLSFIFKRLLMKSATEITFTFNNIFCKQIDG